MVRLFDLRMADGSRHFADLPETYDPVTPQWERLKEHIEGLPGVTSTTLLTDQVTEAWIDFEFEGHTFSINNQHGMWWFFVSDPSCPEDPLIKVYEHCATLLDRS